MAKGKKTGGRSRGTPNKLTGELKDMILQALSKSGGVRYLTMCATDHPAAFLTLVGKVLPLQVTGKDGKDLIPAGGVAFIVREQDGAVNRS